MAEPLTREAILDEVHRIGVTQLGGTLATMHAEDGTPYVTFVLFHLRATGELIFGSGVAPQHSRNMQATPEVSFLIDNREVIREDWAAFDRVIIEGRAEMVPEDDERYAGFLQEIEAKNQIAAYFTEHGQMYVINPRRIILMKGFEPTRHVVNFR
jgi:nitroimidazol reductase NimA-like FMN-containing flavoprotein (pyridoxamine 5'-phosphate oxidase superfamily)